MDFFPVSTFLLQPPNNGTCPDKPNNIPLHWWNVAIASLFILVSGLISLWLGLRLERSLLISSVRCVIQLTIMGLVLEDVFKMRHPAVVLGMIFVLVFLGASEIVFNKSKRRHMGMYASVLFSLGASTMLVGIMGSRFAMHQMPFWDPQVFIPTMGMLLGNCMSAIAVAVSYALEQFSEQKEKIEICLAYGATRWEAGRSVAAEATRLAMLPTINAMSIIGLISIPGMLTGQLIGGAPIMDAIKYQQIIMFMISASSALGVLMSILACIFICIDSSHRLRIDRISKSNPWIYEKYNGLIASIKRGIVRLKNYVCCCFLKTDKPSDQNQILLNENI
ncbi:7564_t:CDS:2 [Dentiscutata heterogama]|uniref:7564_t:CDS:1 n=1 Tax=Dentiscutata heterogama TaxID=1316150 RepID=A0ACA9JXZ3_9GLOM|nr:7564_t:CDS:2 [Dentiscutata heterogama]